MGPAIVTQERPGCQASLHWSRCHRRSRRRHAAFVMRQHVCKLLLAAVREVTDAARARLAAVSCWRMVVSSKAASARFSRALPMRSMVGAVVGIFTWAPPRGLPPPQAWSWCWCLRWARQKATFQVCQVRDPSARPSQLLTSRGKCWATRTAANAIMTSLTSVIGMPAHLAFSGHPPS